MKILRILVALSIIYFVFHIVIVWELASSPHGGITFDGILRGSIFDYLIVFWPGIIMSLFSTAYLYFSSEREPIFRKIVKSAPIIFVLLFLIFLFAKPL